MTFVVKLVSQMPSIKLKPNEISFASVAELFATEVRRGKAPSIEHFATAFPHLADEIRASLPSIALLEQAVGPSDRWRDELPKTLLGECRIEEEIGRGGMGTVYRAVQMELERTVAVKVIALKESFSEKYASRFHLERKAMAKLDHPNIVPVYSYGSDDHYAYLVMKFIDGYSIDRLLQKNASFDAREILRRIQSDWMTFAEIAASIANGLQHSHDQGLIHRDIKPANLLVDRQLKVWISDFGLAKMRDYSLSLSQTGDAIGTPRYMAPEQIKGMSDSRSDVYSLGLSLYELAVGKAIWTEESNRSLMLERSELHLPHLSERVSGIPKPLAEIVMKACQFDPDKRFGSAIEMQDQIESFLASKHSNSAVRAVSSLTLSDIPRDPTSVLKIATVGLTIIATGATLVSSFNRAISSPEADTVGDPVAQVAPLTNTEIKVNYLEKLAGVDGEEERESIEELLKESVEDSTEQFRLSKDEKQQIVSQVDTVLTSMKEKDYSTRDIAKFIDEYRSTSLPMATRMMSYVRVVENSRLSTSQKENAIVLLRRFAKGVINREIPESDAQLVESVLTQGRRVSVTDMAKMRVPNDILLNWLKAMEKRMNILGVRSDNSPIELTPEIEQVFRRVEQSRAQGSR